ncbi:aminotransferase class I/II-fold pyridoxal phosphate-dependent enzyme [Halovivax cerinus]|uniref:8-amino-7-oxononanoate synthase n=1 Tax=Halovivax cerinus TaxID=1487865 RepID=A0ABD5NKJ0_9EURY|nr:8-amino-7-oxononanoate synthase [Halovivax cerinus]
MADDPAATGHGFDLDQRLREREHVNLRRHLDTAAAVAKRTRFVDDSTTGPTADAERLVFASNNYLGLATDDRVQRAAACGARRVGTGAGASRLITGDTGAHRELERDLAACKGADRALVFSSGYAANVGTIAALDPDVIFSDALNHASIVDGCRLADAETIVYDHCNPDDLRDRMAARERVAEASEDWLVVTDTVFSMSGDVAPVADCCAVAEAFGAWTMVDEAHATGVFGDGGGIVTREGLADRVDVQMGTLSKALASQGGYVAGDESLVEYLLNAARSFVFSTGLAPPAAAAAREALRIARDGERTVQLWENVARIREGLESMGYDVRGETQILPVWVGDRRDALALSKRVRERGVLATAIRPPTVPPGSSRIRVTPMATHTDADVRTCLDAFETAGEEVGLL